MSKTVQKEMGLDQNKATMNDFMVNEENTSQICCCPEHIYEKVDPVTILAVQHTY